MSFPTLQNSQVDPMVTDILLAKVNEESEFVAGKLFPTVGGISKESGVIGAISSDHLRGYSSIRSLWDETQHRVKFEYSQDNRYQINYHDLEVYIPQRLIEQSEAPFEPRRDAGFVLLEALRIEREIAVANLVTDTNNITQNVTLVGGSKWTDQQNSNPEQDLQTAIDTVRQKAVKRPNKAVFSYSAFSALKYHPFFVNRVNGINLLTEDQLKDLIKGIFGLEVFVAGSQFVSNKEGQAEVIDNVWGDDVVVFYAPDTPSLFQSSLGYNFTLANKNIRSSYRRHHNDIGEITRVEWAYQDLLTMPECAYLIKSAV